MSLLESLGSIFSVPESDTKISADRLFLSFPNCESGRGVLLEASRGDSASTTASLHAWTKVVFESWDSGGSTWRKERERNGDQGVKFLGHGKKIVKKVVHEERKKSHWDLQTQKNHLWSFNFLEKETQQFVYSVKWRYTIIPFSMAC